MQETLTIVNTIEQLVLVNDFLQHIVDERKIDQTVSMNLKLAVEEAVVNIISYAYPNKKEEEINISIECFPEKIKIIITDTGVPFNPTTKQEPDISLPLEKRPIGGLGTFLVKQLMTDVTYNRSGTKNILTMIKEIKNHAGL